MEEIEGNMKGWEHFQERAKLNAILWDFPKGEIILGVVEMSGTLKENKTYKACDNQGLLTLFYPSPRKAMGCYREFFGRTWKEHWRNRVKNERLGTISGENQV